MNLSNVSYVGIFVEHLPGVLSKDIPNQHVTLAFKPNGEKFFELLNFVGEECLISVVGYGNDGKNEGLLVEIPKEIPYYGARQKHITLSIDPSSSAVKTGYLEFNKEIPENLKELLSVGIVGRVAVFTNEKTLVYNANEFREFTTEKSVADKILEGNVIGEDGFTTTSENNSFEK